MAAIVRSGARRLAGSGLLQRAPAAAGGALSQGTQASGVDALRRPFLARLMSSTGQHARREAPESLSQALEEIKVKKEELYDLLAEARLTDRANRQLLKSLSAQIKPRPNDSQWRWTKTLEFSEDVIKSSIPLAGSFLLGLAMFELQITKTLANKKKQDAAAKEGMVAHA